MDYDSSVLLSGVVFPTIADPEKLQSASVKTYYHAIPGARFIMPNGAVIVFSGGVFATDQREIIRQLDAVANQPASMITTSLAKREVVTALNELAAQDARGEVNTTLPNAPAKPVDIPALNVPKMAAPSLSKT